MTKQLLKVTMNDEETITLTGTIVTTVLGWLLGAKQFSNIEATDVSSNVVKMPAKSAAKKPPKTQSAETAKKVAQGFPLIRQHALKWLLRDLSEEYDITIPKENIIEFCESVTRQAEKIGRKTPYGKADLGSFLKRYVVARKLMDETPEFSFEGEESEETVEVEAKPRTTIQKPQKPKRTSTPKKQPPPEPDPDLEDILDETDDADGIGDMEVDRLDDLDFLNSIEEDV